MNACHKPAGKRATRVNRSNLASIKREPQRPATSEACRVPDEAELITIGRAACGLVHDMRNLAFSMSAVLSRMAGGCGKETWDEDVQSMTACVEYLQSLASRVARLAEPLKPGEAAGHHTPLRQWWAQALPLMKLVTPPRVKLDCSLLRCELWVSLDGNCLTHVLLNLIHNAARALHGREDGRISIWATRDQQVVIIGVSDNGPGLPPQIARELCGVETLGPTAIASTPDNQRDNLPHTEASPRVRTGHGLGIVRDIVLGAGGELRVRTAPNAGTTFMLILPGGTLDQPQA